MFLAAFINSIGLGAFWATYPVMMLDLYGTNNLGRNLGCTFIVSGIGASFLQTLAGEWYAKEIHDGGVRCHGAPCFSKALFVVQAMISISFAFMGTIVHRIPEKRDLQKKGIVKIQYVTSQAEDAYMTGRANMEKNKTEKMKDEIWRDGEIKFKDALALDAYDQIQEIMDDNMSSNKSSDWSNEGVIFKDKLAVDAYDSIEEGSTDDIKFDENAPLKDKTRIKVEVSFILFSVCQCFILHKNVTYVDLHPNKKNTNRKWIWTTISNDYNVISLFCCVSALKHMYYFSFN